MIVPVCEECNGAKSKDDDFLRDLLVIDPFAQHHSVAKEISKTKLLRSAARNSSEIARQVVRQAELTPFYSHGGIYLGDAYSAELDTERLERILFSICQGLLFDAQGIRIPSDYKIEVRRFQPKEFVEVFQSFDSNLNLKGPRTIGEVFWASYVQVEEDHCSCIFLLIFYNGVALSVTILRPDLAQQVSEALPQIENKQFGRR